MRDGKWRLENVVLVFWGNCANGWALGSVVCIVAKQYILLEN